MTTTVVQYRRPSSFLLPAMNQAPFHSTFRSRFPVPGSPVFCPIHIHSSRFPVPGSPVFCPIHIHSIPPSRLTSFLPHSSFPVPGSRFTSFLPHSFILPGSRFPAHQFSSATHHNWLRKMGPAPKKACDERS
jgi:hypothetical protein